MEQYAPRFAKQLTVNRNSGKTVIFKTLGGCVPIPNVFEDSHPLCPSFHAAAEKIIASPKVEFVVVGGAWNLYFIEETKPKSRADFYSYYYLDQGQRHYLSSGGIEFALSELSRFLKRIAEKKPVTLILDNPEGPEFSITGRLNRKSVVFGGAKVDLEFFGSFSIPAEQQKLRERLIALADAVGARVIDPVPWLCEQNRCPVTRSGKPIYLDQNHVRSSFVIDHGEFLDAAIQP